MSIKTIVFVGDGSEYLSGVPMHVNPFNHDATDNEWARIFDSGLYDEVEVTPSPIAEPNENTDTIVSEAGVVETVPVDTALSVSNDTQIATTNETSEQPQEIAS